MLLVLIYLHLNNSLNDLNYSGYGEVVSLISTTSESNPFIVPSNGLLILEINGVNSLIYAKIESFNKSFNIGTSSNWEYGVSNILIPVFKGMKIYELSKAGSFNIYFIPFINK